jgi:hypothetical protein
MVSAPNFICLATFFGLGIVGVVALIMRYNQSSKIAASISILLVVLLLAVLAKSTVVAMLSYKGDTRGQSYTNLSRWFREHAKNSESIAFIEIGYLGYYTDNRVIDLAGLIVPDIVPHVAQKDFVWGFWQYQPDYYIYLPDYDWMLAEIRSDPRFERQYRPVASLQGPRDTDFVIYKRHGEQAN